MGARRWGWAAVAPALLAAAWLAGWSRTSPASDPAVPDGAATALAIPAPPAVGAGRCSAAACHGSPSAVFGSRVRRDEHTIWLGRDPHARAYEVLHNDLSKLIARNLGRGTGRPTPAHLDARCLACHSTPTPGPAPADSAALVRQEGVGCEACHGTASAWLGLHATYDWDGVPAEVKEGRYGMTRTKDLARRAETCAGCHVGEPARAGRPRRDVDHDLIAAGHPALRFEFSAFLANLPPHWVEQGSNARDDFPARAWAIGQVASAKTALELLRARALAAAGQAGARGHAAPWPEFSEFDCASCHHVLRDPPLRIRGVGRGRTSGTPAWGTWHFPALRSLAALTAGDGPRAFEALIGPLGQAMAAGAPPAEAAAKADAASRALARWLQGPEEATLPPARVEALVRRFAAPASGDGQGPADFTGWEADAQRYLALVPLRQALVAGARDVPGLLEQILRLREHLKQTPGPIATGDTPPAPPPNGR